MSLGPVPQAKLKQYVKALQFKGAAGTPVEHVLERVKPLVASAQVEPYLT